MSLSKICVAVDIEKTGCFINNNKVVSVGFYVGNTDGAELKTLQVNFAVSWPSKHSVTNQITNYRDFEERCWTEFWEAKISPEIVNSFLVDTYEYKDGWTAVNNFLNELETSYPEDQYKIVFLTDNASFDVASIDSNLEKYVGRKPMRYSGSGRYRSIYSADDMFDMLPSDIKTTETARINGIVTADHNPVNDAHYIYEMYMSVLAHKPA